MIIRVWKNLRFIGPKHTVVLNAETLNLPILVPRCFLCNDDEYRLEEQREHALQ